MKKGTWGSETDSLALRFEQLIDDNDNRRSGTEHNKISSGYLHFINSHVVVVHFEIRFGRFCVRVDFLANATLKKHEIVVYTDYDHCLLSFSLFPAKKANDLW